jgi:stage IV sporulation protein FB
MPKGTFNTGIKPFGVPLCIHWSAAFLLLIFLSFDLVGGIWKLAILLGSLLFHEYGHVFAAKKLGYSAEHVLVHGAGAFAYVRHDINFYKSARDIAIVAGAGPLASMVLWFSSWML